MQGYLFSRPVPPEDIPDLLQASRLLSPPLQPLEPIDGCAARSGLLATAPKAGRRLRRRAAG